MNIPKPQFEVSRVKTDVKEPSPERCSGILDEYGNGKQVEEDSFHFSQPQQTFRGIKFGRPSPLRPHALQKQVVKVTTNQPVSKMGLSGSAHPWFGYHVMLQVSNIPVVDFKFQVVSFTSLVVNHVDKSTTIEGRF